MRTLPLLLLAAGVEFGSGYYSVPGGLCPSDVQIEGRTACANAAGSQDWRTAEVVENAATQDVRPKGCYREVVDLHTAPNCPWLNHSGRMNKMECWDGSFCDVRTVGVGWRCCSGKGGRKRCP
eukprot:Hpha_TRINITY_DN15756_c4_g10::TRINITY_DN15756_c4_g10_i1::g.39948::m.39948